MGHPNPKNIDVKNYGASYWGNPVPNPVDAFDQENFYYDICTVFSSLCFTMDNKQEGKGKHKCELKLMARVTVSPSAQIADNTGSGFLEGYWNE